MKREHGEDYPSGAESVAAPATVSGESPVKCHWSPLFHGGHRPGRRPGCSDPQVRRPAIALVLRAVRDGVSFGSFDSSALDVEG